jgi:hypothetical protein
MLDRKKIIHYLDIYSNEPPLAGIEDGVFLPAICHLQLGNYSEAKGLFEKSISAMFKPVTIWKGSGHCDFLVDICLLSGRNDLYSDVQRELDIFRHEHIMINQKWESLYFVYADSVMELLLFSNMNILQRIQVLLKKPKFKNMYTIGLTLQAIIDKNQIDFNRALENMLQVHEGQAKHGDLRWTAEGLVCLSAMTLSYIAIKHGLKIEVKNDYLSTDYLQFLMGA